MTKKAILLVFFSLLTSYISAQEGTLIVVTDPRVPHADVNLIHNQVTSRLGQLDNYGIIGPKNIRPGLYILSVKKEGFAEYQEQIEIRNGVTTTKTISLKLAASGLFITCNLAEASVYLDGEYLGRTSFEGNYLVEDIALGTHHLEISKANYESHSQTIDITPSQIGTTFTVNARLNEKKASSKGSLIVYILAAISLGVGILVFVLIKIIGSFRKMKSRFDRYLIKELLGRGGMSTVYRAIDLATKKENALKIMDDRFLGDKDLINKFQREGECLFLINREYPDAPVVKVFRYGTENSTAYGRPFIAMELLRGASLLELINQKKPIALVYIVQVIRQVALALSAAHPLKIYHRDVTPDNIIIVKNNPNSPQIKLIDFGVAKHEYCDVGTLDGTISGKPPYMSPEQCKGEKVDERSDIYSLGIIFYTLLAGHPPFASNNPLEVMYFHEHTPVPPLPETIPVRIQQIVIKMLAKEKDNRYENMNEFLKDINKLET